MFSRVPRYAKLFFFLSTLYSSLRQGERFRTKERSVQVVSFMRFRRIPGQIKVVPMKEKVDYALLAKKPIQVRGVTGTLRPNETHLAYLRPRLLPTRPRSKGVHFFLPVAHIFELFWSEILFIQVQVHGSRQKNGTAPCPFSTRVPHRYRASAIFNLASLFP